MGAEAEWIGISIITELEFLSFSNLSSNDAALFQQFKSRIYVIPLETSNSSLLKTIVQLRQSYNLKLPDAIIAGSALSERATLVSNDAVFSRVHTVAVKTF